MVSAVTSLPHLQVAEVPIVPDGSAEYRAVH